MPDGRKIAHLYYGSGHLHQTSLYDGKSYQTIADYERDNLHREISRSQGKLTQLTQYDSVGRITRKTAKVSALSQVFAPVITKHFKYDNADNLTY